MIRRLIVHAGMHKTGSTSIQHWLRNAELADAHYFGWTKPNHSTLYTLLFEDKPYEYFGLKRQGYTVQNTPVRREEARRALIGEVKNNNVSTFVFSAERISSAPEESIVRMRRFFAQFFDDIQVYAYVRQPAGFMTSMFQQHLKTWAPRVTVRQLWPEYQRRFTRIDNAFQKKHVHLRLYDDLCTRKTDAVDDFLSWSGLTGNGGTAVRRNSSMRSDTVALLYFYRMYVAPQLEQRLPPELDAQVVHELLRVGGDSFVLSLPADPDFDRKRLAEIKWMSDRMGVEINDLEKDDTVKVVYRSDADLTTAAISASHKLQADYKILDPSISGSREATEARLFTMISRISSQGSDQSRWEDAR